MTPGEPVDDAVDRILTHLKLRGEPAQGDTRLVWSSPRNIQPPNLPDLGLRQACVRICLPAHLRFRQCGLPPTALRNGISNVVRLRPRPQMIRTDTEGDIASVQDQRTGKQAGVDVQKVRNTVGRNSRAVQPEPSVFFRGMAPPQPTAVSGTVRHKGEKTRTWVWRRSVLAWVDSCWHVSILPQVTATS